jgi:hypothetical protein
VNGHEPHSLSSTSRPKAIVIIDVLSNKIIIHRGERGGDISDFGFNSPRSYYGEAEVDGNYKSQNPNNKQITMTAIQNTKSLHFGLLTFGRIVCYGQAKNNKPPQRQKWTSKKSSYKTSGPEKESLWKEVY